MVTVLLIDDYGRTLLVECLDTAQAEALGRAAIYSDGGVSAWRLPARPGATSDDVAKIAEELRNGGNLADVDGVLGR